MQTLLLQEKSTHELFVLKSGLALTNEAELLYGIEHKNLPSYEKTAEGFTLRKYISGVSLEEYIVDNNFDITLTIDVCEVLEFLHSQNIIHRDIKPSNIIITSESKHVTLIDFGISRKFSENAETDTIILGTQKFAPPEQYGFAQTDNRTDIYALGVVMRYWLTGSADRSAKIEDSELERIVNKCTELSQQLRFQSASELKTTLNQYMSGYKKECNTWINDYTSNRFKFYQNAFNIFSAYDIADYKNSDWQCVESPVYTVTDPKEQVCNIAAFAGHLKKGVAYFEKLTLKEFDENGNPAGVWNGCVYPCEEREDSYLYNDVLASGFSLWTEDGTGMMGLDHDKKLVFVTGSEDGATIGKGFYRVKQGYSYQATVLAKLENCDEFAHVMPLFSFFSDD